MAIDANIPLLARGVNVGQAIDNALLGVQRMNEIKQMPLQNQMLEERLKALQGANEHQGLTNQALKDEQRLANIARAAKTLKPVLEKDPQAALRLAVDRLNNLNAQGIDSTETAEFIDYLQRGDVEGAKSMLDSTLAAAGQMAQKRILGAEKIRDPKTGEVRTVVPIVDEAGNRTVVDIGESGQMTLEEQLNLARGKSEINIQEAAGTRSATNQVERNANVINKGIEAAQQIPNIQRMLELLKTVETSGLLAAKTAVTDFFGKTPADVGEFRALAGERVLSALDAFSGAISDSERKFVERMRESISQGKEVNERTLQRALQILENQRQRGIKRAQDTNDTFALEDLNVDSKPFEISPEAVNQQQDVKQNRLDELRTKYGFK